ncbi:hypothetical protein KUCAC02_014745 [Chaenocephalus aceratus]|uniref:Uncharacterized protein n=1 Tax=Chaenocephalus aceratus TaxID=36190 RepID=A0ACB9WGA6_CHAAC|nr:hypothetical protein KUCAC02_014745 [Chaenocephalus aceratus]
MELEMLENEKQDAIWSYPTCPDVEECRLGLHNCHSFATCINTPTRIHQGRHAALQPDHVDDLLALPPCSPCSAWKDTCAPPNGADVSDAGTIRPDANGDPHHCSRTFGYVEEYGTKDTRLRREGHHERCSKDLFCSGGVANPQDGDRGTIAQIFHSANTNDQEEAGDLHDAELNGQSTSPLLPYPTFSPLPLI